MIDTLRDTIASTGLIENPQVNGGVIFGRARIAAIDADVWFNIDPELDEEDAPDSAALLRAIERMLALSSEQWQVILGEVVTEIEDAVGDEPIEETTPLRDDLALNSVVVFADATLLRFEAPRQFPHSWVQVQLDDDFMLEDLAIEEKDDEPAEEFTSLDDLQDHLTQSD